MKKSLVRDNKKGGLAPFYPNREVLTSRVLRIV
jgi:hypothetical protein